jgi:hypothetical protein
MFNPERTWEAYAQFHEEEVRLMPPLFLGPRCTYVRDDLAIIEDGNE